MEKKYTTGSWSFKIENDKAYFSGEGWHHFGCVYVAMYGGEYDSPEGLANAHLIAAAPDLLEALEQLVSDYERGIHVEFGGSPWLKEKLEELDYARAAIRKAHGEVTP